MIGHVAVVGRCAWDEWIGVESSRAPDNNFGGSGANIAVTLVALGAEVELLSQIGADEKGQRLHRHLRARGVGTSWLQITDGRTAVCDISPGVSYSWRGGFVGVPDIGDNELRSAMFGASSLVLSDNDLPCVGLDSLPRYWLPQLWLRDGEADPLKTLRRARKLRLDGVFVNESERRQLEDLCGTDLLGLSSLIPDVTFVSTSRADPTELFADGVRVKFPVPLAPDLQIAVGGGDALVSGCVYGRLRGHSWARSLKLGQRLARAAVSQVGCQVPPGVVGGERVRWERSGR